MMIGGANRWLAKVILLMAVLIALRMSPLCCSCGAPAPGGAPIPGITFSQAVPIVPTPSPTPMLTSTPTVMHVPKSSLTPIPSPTSTPTLASAGGFEDVPWPTLLDGEITFRVASEKEPPGGQDSINAWAERTIESGWGIEAHLGDFINGVGGEVDLVITFEDDLYYGGQRACGVAPIGGGTCCHITLSRWCWDRDFVYEDVPEKALLHEVGHCMGLSHRGWGVMAIPIQNWTTEEDIKEIREVYGLDR